MVIEIIHRKNAKNLFIILEDKSNRKIPTYMAKCTCEVDQNNDQEGNQKIVDGVIKVGSVAFRRLSLMSPFVPGRKKN